MEDVPCLYVPVDTNPRAHCEGFPAVTVATVRESCINLLREVELVVDSMKPLKHGIETLMVHVGLNTKKPTVSATQPPHPTVEHVPETPPKPQGTPSAKGKAPMKASEDPSEHVGNPPSPSDSADDEDDEGSNHGDKGSKHGRTPGRSTSTPFVGNFVSKDSSGMKFKPSKPKDFDGTRTELKGFLSQTKVYLAFYGIWEDVKKVLIAQSFFTGKVRTWFQPFLDDWLRNGHGGKQATVRIFSKFEELEKELHQIYGDSDERQTAIRRLEALRQTTSAATYKSEFQQLIPVVGWDSSALQRQFWKGLKNDVQDVLVRSEDPATLEDLIEQAIKVDNRLFSLRQERKTAGERKQKSGKDRQERPRKSSHTTRSVRKDEGARLRMERFRAGACLACGKKGHLKKDCPEKQVSKQVARVVTETPSWYDMPPTPTPTVASGTARNPITIPDDDDQEWEHIVPPSRSRSPRTNTGVPAIPTPPNVCWIVKAASPEHPDHMEMHEAFCFDDGVTGLTR